MKPASRLSELTLHECKNAGLPDYDRSKVTTGIVHLGIGNFHRAHQAVYIDHCLAADPQWGITGVSLRKADMAEALRPQDGLYTLLEHDENGTHASIIASIKKMLPATEGVAPILASLSAATTRIASLTITEKGYLLDVATGRLNPALDEVRQDLENRREPRTAPGLLVEALRLRREAGLGPFTLLSCDNLSGNGHMLARLVSDFAALHSDKLAQWIDNNITSPNTMVDRIVPSTTDDDRAEALSITGLEDKWPVTAEAFSQWVVEDAFVAGRPDLGDVGVQLVSDVAPFEHMKLRMLNGAHSALAYLGQLAGHETVRDAIRDEKLASFIRDLWREEIIPTLDRPREEAESYALSLVKRFENPGMRHLTRQVAMDGSQKIPQRILPTIRDRLAKSQPIARLCQVLAAWLTYVSKGDTRFTIEDPLEPRFASLRTSCRGNLGRFAEEVMRMEQIFGDLAPNQALHRQVLAALNKPLKD